MSALRPKADIAESDWPVRFVPTADVAEKEHHLIMACLSIMGRTD
jgi:hypothetical protein